MIAIESNKWRLFVTVVKNFVENKRSAIWIDFPKTMAILATQCERFHKDIKFIEERYQGHCCIGMMADCRWSLKRDTEDHHNNSCQLQKMKFVSKLLSSFLR